MKALKDRLTYARELRGMTQQELARLAGCSQSAIGNVEAGERHSLRNLIDIARALRVSPEWLYDGNGPAPKAGIAAEEPPGEYHLWPFSTPFERYAAMPPSMKALVDRSIAATVEAAEDTKSHDDKESTA